MDTAAVIYFTTDGTDPTPSSSDQFASSTYDRALAHMGVNVGIQGASIQAGTESCTICHRVVYRDQGAGAQCEVHRVAGFGETQAARKQRLKHSNVSVRLRAAGGRANGRVRLSACAVRKGCVPSAVETHDFVLPSHCTAGPNNPKAGREFLTNHLASAASSVRANSHVLSSYPVYSVGLKAPCHHVYHQYRVAITQDYLLLYQLPTG
jgi:hypothetical protein